MNGNENGSASRSHQMEGSIREKDNHMSDLLKELKMQDLQINDLQK